MSETDRLRDLLEQTAPDRPDVDATSRAAAVARRGRRARVRDRALVATAAVALVAAVGVPFALGYDTEEEVAYPTTDPVAVEPCPVTPAELTELGRPVTGLGDVVAVRSCPTQDQTGVPLLPAAPLTGADAKAFAEDLAATPAYRMPSFCLVATVMHQPWALQLQTSGGDLLTIGSPTRTCSFVLIDGVERGVDQVIAAFEGNLARQQAGGPGDLACPPGPRLTDGAPTWNASFDPSTAVAGRVCYVPDGAGGGYRPTAYLDGDELATIRDDLAANRTLTSDDGMCIDTGPQRMVLLEDADGDQAAWVDDHCTGQFAGPGGYWLPGPEADLSISRALGLAITT